MEIVAAKCIALSVFFLIPITLGTLCLWLYTRCRRQSKDACKTGLPYLNCFAGGVFLATCLLIVLGQGLSKFEQYRHLVNLHYQFPFFEAGIGAGFFLVALIEKLAHLALEHGRRRQHHHHDNGDGDNKNQGKINTPFTTLSEVDDDDLYEFPENWKAAAASEKRGPSPASPAKSRSSQSQDHSGGRGGGVDTSAASSFQHLRSGDNDDDDDDDRDDSLGQSPEKADLAKGVGGKSFESEASLGCASGSGSSSGSGLSVLRVIFLLVALSFHTVFDGLALGLLTDVRKVVTMMVAIAIHKAVMSGVLGVELASVFHQRTLSRPFLALLLFSLASPLGVAIGIGVTSGHAHKGAELLTGAVLQAVATGAFLYVTCFEILARDMAAPRQGVLHVLAAAFGFVVITAIETTVA